MKIFGLLHWRKEMKKIKLISEFGLCGLKIIFINILINLFKRKKYFELKYKIINKILIEYFDFEQSNYSVIDNKKYVFVFWWDGIENSPLLVRKCIESQKKFFNGYDKFIVLNKTNIKDYADLNPIFYEKLNAGIITLAQFSDILRLYLLSHYNCYWIDATIFISDVVTLDPKNIFTLKYKDDFHYVSKNRWTGFFIYSDKTYIYGYKFMEKYWKKHNVLLDYFLIDYIINSLYSNFGKFKQNIDENALNIDMYHLTNILFDEVDDNSFNKAIKEIKINKLNWKLKIPDEFLDNKKIIINRIMQSR